MAIINYSYQKNLKEQARKKKREEKRLAKLAKKNALPKTDTEQGLGENAAVAPIK